MRKTQLVLVVVLALLLVGCSTTTTGATRATRTAGRVYTIPSSIAANCSTDVTTAINAWVASVPNGTATNPSILKFKAGACYRVAGTIGAADDTSPAGYQRSHLLFEGNGSTIDGSKDVPPMHTNRAGVGITGGHDITVQDFTIKGDNNGKYRDSTGNLYDNPCNIPLNDATTACHADSTGGAGFTHDYEWQHGVGVYGGDHITFRHNNIYNVFGDGVFLGQGPTSNVTTNTVVDGNSVSGTGRMGVGITSDDQVQVTGNTFDRISYNTVDVENEAQQLTNITFSGNTINREWFGFWTAETGECLPRGNYVIDNNVMKWSTVNVANPIRLDSAQCSGPHRSGLEIKGNTLWHDQCAAGNPTIGYWDQAAIQVKGWDNVAIDNNRIITCGRISVASVRLNNVGGTLEVNNNDMRENPYVYGLNDVADAPGVTACGNMTSVGPNQLTAC